MLFLKEKTLIISVGELDIQSVGWVVGDSETVFLD